MQASRTPKQDATRVALVLDAGGARSAYQVGALEVLLPALAESGTRPRLLVGTSAGALLTGALSATAHLEPDDQVARLKSMLGQTTKQNVMRPLWRQVPEVLARYTSETFGLSYFRLRGLFGSQPLAQTLAKSSTGMPCTTTSGMVSSSPRPSRRRPSEPGESSCSPSPAPPYRTRHPSTTGASSPPGLTSPI